MDWISQFQLFLFDFDGLLVNTEKMHMKAYEMMCNNRGFDFPWDFDRYCIAAHFESTGLRDQLYEALPQLKEEESDWNVLYQEKKKAYLKLLEMGAVELMPGAKELLEELANRDCKRCVVTHSPMEQIENIKAQIPLLKSIPIWITREDYSEPKPSPVCYQTAIKRHANEGDAVIGFEDSPRGLQALRGSGAFAVWISDIKYQNQDEILEMADMHFQDIPTLQKWKGIKTRL